MCLWKAISTYLRPLWIFARRLPGVRLLNPLRVGVTSGVLELVRLGLGNIELEEVTEGLIKAAIENSEGLGFVCSGSSETLSGVALKKSQKHFMKHGCQM